MWDKVLTWVFGILGSFGLGYFENKRKQREEAARVKALKNAYKTERNSNEMDHTQRHDSLSKWVRKDGD